MAIVTASTLVEWNSTGTWVDITAFVVRVPDGVSQLTTGSDQPLAFGDSAESTCSFNVLDTLTAGVDVTGYAIRVTFSINAVPIQTFVGIITEQAESTIDAVVTLSCVGASEAIRVTKAYSPAFYLRPVATKTSAGSVEDITNGAYAGGLMNYALWRSGGRPFEQAGSYPSAAFYYSLDQAILAPTWSWLAGEDGWAELQKLAQAAGGMLYQGIDGVVRYKNPLNIVANSPIYPFDATQYGSATRSRKRGQLATKVIVSYIPRQARPLQEVVDDTTPRLIHHGATVTFSLEPQWPLKSLEISSGVVNIEGMSGGAQLSATALIVTDLTGQIINQGGSGYTHTLTPQAQRITIAVTNAANRPIVLWRVVLRGEPITAGEAGNVEVGSGTAERQVGENPFIQSAGHATRLANLILTFYNTARASVEVSDGVFDPARSVGEVVNFTASRWGVSAVSHVIVKIAHKETGAKADYTLAPVAGLPAASSYYIVSASAQTGPKLVAF